MNEKKIETVINKLGNYKLLLASSSEPYVHFYRGGEIQWRGGTGGVATAFDSLMKAYGGTWVSVGIGTADKETSDKKGKLKVPPDAEKYTLKRVWINKKEEEGFLGLSSNSGVWPLSHMVYVRPEFQEDAWEQYRKVNKRIAEGIAEEADDNTIVWINDYQLTLCAKYLKELKPEISTGFFWHIPWPNAEVFKICPWHDEILEALLYNDVIAFHTSAYKRNFFYSIESLPGSTVNWHVGIARHGKNSTIVRNLPISIDYTGIEKIASEKKPQELKAIRKTHGLLDVKMLIAVDRMDYTKGIPEKLKALDLLFTRRPDLIGKVTLVQVAAPTRTTLSAYKQALEQTLETTDAVNWKYSMGNWKPIILLNEYVSLSDIIALYKTADACIVTSLHDGMNLVSKEYIASNEGNGVLVLSKFAGSAQELKQAIQVNPFLTEDITNGIEKALEMKPEEKAKRMSEMKKTVSNYDIFKWAAEFIETLAGSKNQATQVKGKQE